MVKNTSVLGVQSNHFQVYPKGLTNPWGPQNSNFPSSPGRSVLSSQEESWPQDKNTISSPVMCLLSVDEKSCPGGRILLGCFGLHRCKNSMIHGNSIPPVRPQEMLPNEGLKDPTVRLSQLGTPGVPGPSSGHWLPMVFQLKHLQDLRFFRLILTPATTRLKLLDGPSRRSVMARACALRWVSF